MGCLRSVYGVSAECLWGVCGVSAECLWGVCGVSAECLWSVSVELCLWGCRLEQLEEGFGHRLVHQQKVGPDAGLAA